MSINRSNSQKSSNQHWNKLLLELLVVFLGVTAGFVLNNWRMNQQEKQLEKKYLGGFLQDAESNYSELAESIKSDSLWLVRNKPILQLVRENRLTVDSAKSAIVQIATIGRIDFNKGTYEDIINSGNLNIINKFETKTLIVEYHLAISGVGFVEDYFHKFYDDYVIPFIFDEFNVLTGEFKNPKIIHTLRFSNVFAGYSSMVQQRLQAYKNLMHKNKRLLEALKKS